RRLPLVSPCVHGPAGCAATADLVFLSTERSVSTPPMKACVFTANHEPMVVEELTLDPPTQPGEVHVKWAASGVCHSDLSIWEGKLPIPPGSILGHEGAGVVISAIDSK